MRRRSPVRSSNHFAIGELVGVAAWRRWTLASFLARLPISMGLLGLMLAGEYATGSLATGAEMAGAMMFTAGILGPWRGARMDRREMRRALQVSSFILAGAFGGLAIAVSAKAPSPVLFAFSIAAGYGLAGMWGGFRALLLVVVTPAQLRQAHFVESLMVEVTYLLGPLAVGLLVGLTNAVVGIVVMSLFACSSAVALRGVAILEPREVVRAGAPWRDPTVAVIYVFAFALGFGFGAIESNVAARMEGYGLASDAAGTFLALLALGSCIGGIAVSLRPLRTNDAPRLAGIMLLAFAAMVIPSTLAGSSAAFAMTLLFASLMLVPLNGLGNSELEHRLKAGQRAEAFSWYIAATMMGGGIGSVANGTLAKAFEPKIVPMISASVFALTGVSLLVLRLVGRRRVVAGPATVPRITAVEELPLVVDEQAAT